MLEEHDPGCRESAEDQHHDDRGTRDKDGCRFDAQRHGLLVATSAVVGFFVLMILAVAISSIGARWVQAARPVAADSAVAKAERKKLLSRSRRTMALLFAVLLAIIFPFIPEFRSVNPILSVLGGAVSGAVVGWLIGHLFGSDVWADLMPRIEK